jgi:hypothetical protein
VIGSLNDLEQRKLSGPVYATDDFKMFLTKILHRLSTRHKTNTTASLANDAELFGNSATFDIEYDGELSSRTSIDLNLEDAVYSRHQEQQSSQGHIHAHPSSPEYDQSQSALSDVTTDVLSSVLPTTPRSRREQNSQILAAVKTPRRPRATGGDEDRYPGYTEHPSPSLRAYHGKTLGEDEDLDLQQVQSMAFAINQQKSRPFEALLATATTEPVDEDLPNISGEIQEVGGGRNHDVRDDEDGSQDGYATTFSAYDTRERSALMNNFTLNNNQTSPIHDHAATYMAEDDMIDENSIPYDGTHQDVLPQHAFAYVDVVRNKYERTKMHGTTCACCSEVIMN